MAKSGKTNGLLKNARYKNKVYGFIIIAMVILILGFSFRDNLGFTVVTDSEKQEQEIEDKILKSTLSTEWCIQNPEKTIKVNIEDLHSSSGAFLNGSTILLSRLDKDGMIDSTTEHTITGGVTGDYTSIATDLNCLGYGYELRIKGATPINSEDKFLITQGMLRDSVNTLYHTFKTTKYSLVKAKAYDNNGRAKLYSSTNSTDFQTGASQTFYQSTASTAFNITSSDYLDISFTLGLETDTGVKGELMYIAFNTGDESNINDWNREGLQVIYNGEVLQLTTGLSESEMQGLIGSDAIYKVESTGLDNDGNKVSTNELRFLMSPKTDQDPDFDIVVKLVALGDVKSSRSQDVLENVGFTDATTPVELYTAQIYTIPID